MIWCISEVTRHHWWNRKHKVNAKSWNNQNVPSHTHPQPFFWSFNFLEPAKRRSANSLSLLDTRHSAFFSYLKVQIDPEREWKISFLKLKRFILHAMDNVGGFMGWQWCFMMIASLLRCLLPHPLAFFLLSKFECEMFSQFLFKCRFSLPLLLNSFHPHPKPNPAVSRDTSVRWPLPVHYAVAPPLIIRLSSDGKKPFAFEIEVNAVLERKEV